MVKIKICGLKRSEDIQMVNRYQPDYGGFVFAGTKRKIDANTAGKLREQMDSQIQAVGVFVNAEIDFIESLCKNNTIQLIQLHGDEDKAYISKLRDRVNVPLIKAVRVRSTEQIEMAEKLDVDFLLLDTYVKDAYGGSGKTFDKSMIPPLTKPYFLAGGITTENVLENLNACVPYGVDISSGVETDGYKDEKKIRDFIQTIRGADV